MGCYQKAYGMLLNRNAYEHIELASACLHTLIPSCSVINSLQSPRSLEVQHQNGDHAQQNVECIYNVGDENKWEKFCWLD
jgi:hypothetical protein